MVGVAAVSAVATTQALALDAELSRDDMDGRSGGIVEADRSGLAKRASDALSREAADAMRILSSSTTRLSILEDAQFVRSGGVVRGRAWFWDGAGPRDIRMYVDAFGDGPVPLASFPFEFTSSGARQPIDVSIQDLPAFRRFALRLTSEGAPLDLAASLDAARIRVVGVSPDAVLFGSDYGELRKLLEQRDMIAAQSFEADAMLGAVRRFRRANGIDGPNYVSLGDLFALRLAGGRSTGPTSLIPYVEWSSGSLGGLSAPREEFAEQISDQHDEEVPADESDDTEMDDE